MARFTLLGTQIAILGCMVWAAIAGPLRAPIFSSEARAPAASGHGWYAGGLHEQYLTKTYAMALARGWLTKGMAGDEEAVRMEAADHARGAARQAIVAAPTNGYAWAALGWAEMLAGNRGAALEAVARARDWAPAAPELALDRALIAQTWWPDLDDTTREEVLADVWLASQSYGHRFREAAAASPRLATLFRIARVRYGS